LIAEDPMSSPTSPFVLPNRPTRASLLQSATVCDRAHPSGAATNPANRDDARTYEKVVKVLAEPSKASPGCQAKNEGYPGK
jgi:hypothetical protein